MNELLKLAWRNIWRNKWRTVITLASVFMAVFIALCMRASQLGFYQSWTDNVVQTYSGYIQVQSPEYLDNKSIDNSLEFSPELADKINSDENVSLLVPRVESFAMAAVGNQSKVVMVMGVDPKAENEMTSLKNKVVNYRFTDEAIQKIAAQQLPGEYLEKIKKQKGKSYAGLSGMQLDLGMSDDEFETYKLAITEASAFGGDYFADAKDQGVLVADRLAKFLKILPGDTLVLIGQGYQGRSAAGKYPVRGILRFPLPEIDKTFVCMSTASAQEFFGVSNRLTSIALNLHETDMGSIRKTVKRLKKSLGEEDYSVQDWQELNKEIVQQIESDNVSGLFMLWIIYVLIGFGILGTVLMMTNERRREFGVMLAVGMQRIRMVYVVVTELIFLGLLGVISGSLASLPIVLYYQNNPIVLEGDMAKMMEDFGVEPLWPFIFDITSYAAQAAVVMVLVLLAAIYPVVYLLRLREMKALRA